METMVTRMAYAGTLFLSDKNAHRVGFVLSNKT